MVVQWCGSGKPVVDVTKKTVLGRDLICGMGNPLQGAATTTITGPFSRVTTMRRHTIFSPLTATPSSSRDYPPYEAYPKPPQASQVTASALPHASPWLLPPPYATHLYCQPCYNVMAACKVHHSPQCQPAMCSPIQDTADSASPTDPESAYTAAPCVTPPPLPWG
ncbi:hypothetical protein EDB85DRAFT_1899149 [Lactarius pseudohatsudake]|nr:hypothetical protein EDB85DRAFT_1899149 [Lactarius pseudohatsudake]